LIFILFIVHFVKRYGIVTERRQVLERLIKEEKEKQRTALIQLHSTEGTCIP
jgi:hypothetical protein